jgi:hopene-associated glycosyltransferase HpnB
MPALATIVATLTAVTWSYLALARGSFWRLKSASVRASDKSGFSGCVAAIVPARDEAELIGPVVTSLLNQRVAMHVFLVDDESTDGTADVARRAAEKAGKADALIVIQSKPLPAGWTGKLWAMHQGIERARTLDPVWLMLADADVLHNSETVTNLGFIASHGHYDLVSFMVKLQCDTMAEKLLIPPYIFFFFMLYPPRWVADPRRKVAGAAGGCILVRREALTHAGGVEAIRAEVIDDCALARLIKRSGGHVWLGLTDKSVSVRGYESATIWRMIARNAFSQLHHSSWLLAGAVAGMCVVYLAPPLLLLSGTRLSIALGAAAWLTMTVAYWPMVRFYRLNPAWSLTLPAAALFYTAATLHSALKYWSGQGGRWKGRVQDRAGL